MLRVRDCSSNKADFAHTVFVFLYLYVSMQ